MDISINTFIIVSHKFDDDFNDIYTFINYNECISVKIKLNVNLIEAISWFSKTYGVDSNKIIPEGTIGSLKTMYNDVCNYKTFIEVEAYIKGARNFVDFGNFTIEKFLIIANVLRKLWRSNKQIG